MCAPSISGSVFLRLVGRFFSVGHSNNEADQFFKLLEKHNVKDTDGAEQLSETGRSTQLFGAFPIRAEVCCNCCKSLSSWILQRAKRPGASLRRSSWMCAASPLVANSRTSSTSVESIELRKACFRWFAAGVSRVMPVPLACSLLTSQKRPYFERMKLQRSLTSITTPSKTIGVYYNNVVPYHVA